MILFAILACPQEISEETTESLLRQCNIGEQKLIRDKQSLTRQAGALQQVCAMTLPHCGNIMTLCKRNGLLQLLRLYEGAVLRPILPPIPPSLTVPVLQLRSDSILCVPVSHPGDVIYYPVQKERGDDRGRDNIMHRRLCAWQTSMRGSCGKSRPSPRRCRGSAESSCGPVYRGRSHKSMWQQTF